MGVNVCDLNRAMVHWQTKPLNAETLPDVERLVEANNGVWCGGSGAKGGD
jgi:hypothetical protein